MQTFEALSLGGCSPECMAELPSCAEFESPEVCGEGDVVDTRTMPAKAAASSKRWGEAPLIETFVEPWSW